jgi:glycosyltransferase involved in cell wall biosynthesis
VSVVVPTHDHRDHVLAALDSVFAQTFTDREVVVVDDGSTDDTSRLLAPLAGDGRIRCLTQPHRGQAAARNRGIAAARGEFTAMLDDDDLWPPDKLAWQVAALDTAPEAGMVFGFCRSFGEGPHFTYPEADTPSGRVRDAFLVRNRIISPGQVLFRTATLRALDGFDESLWGTDDWDLYVRLAARAPCLYVHRLALHYRRHPGAASRDWPRLYRNARRVLRRHLGPLPSPGTFRVWLAGDRDLRHFYAARFVERADALAAAGDRAGARRLWRRALRMHPTELRRRRGLRTLLGALGLPPPPPTAPAVRGPEAPPSRCPS